VRYVTATVRESWKISSKRCKIWLSYFTVFLIFVASLDGFAIGLLSKSLSSEGLETDSKKALSHLLAVALLFLLKGVLAALGTFFIFKEIAREETSLGTQSFTRYQNLSWINQYSLRLSELVNLVDRGPTAVMQTVLVLAAFLIAEVGSVILVLLFFSFIDPLTACTSLVTFSAIALLQNQLLSKIAINSSKRVTTLESKVLDLLKDAHTISKTLAVMPSQSLNSELLLRRKNLAEARSVSVFLESLPRYLMEMLIIFGSCIVALFVVILGNPDSILASLAIFGVVGFRIIPSINRLQGLLLGIIKKAPLVHDLISFSNCSSESVSTKREFIDFPTEKDCVLELKSVSFSYPSGSQPVIKNVSLSIYDGLQYAFIGPSGSGKTTLADLCLGILEPSSGEISRRHPVKDSAVAYVSQDSVLIEGDLYNNVSLEWSRDTIDESLVVQTMRKLTRTSKDLQKFLSPQDNPLALSGGQEQRVGLARALYREPKLLVMDEPTSNLDAEHESQLVELINELKGWTTTIIIAHRLTTVQNADVIVYIEDGMIRGAGTYSELKNSIPEFAKQIELGSLIVK